MVKGVFGGQHGGGDVQAKAAVSLGAILLLAALAGCGRNELSCDGSEETEAVLDILKKDPPTQLLETASSETIQQQQQQLEDKVHATWAANGRCDAPAKENWLREFASAFPWYEPKPTSFDQDQSSICSRMTTSYIDQHDAYHDEQAMSAVRRMERECIEMIHRTEQQGSASCNKLNAKIDSQRADNTGAIDELKRSAYAATVYTLEAIRLEGIDQTTGSIVCNAKLRADIPKLGAAEEDVQYKIEKTTDGNLYATIQGAD